MTLLALGGTAKAQTIPTGQPNGTPHQTTLSWTASPSGAAGYNVYRSTTAGGEAGTQALNGATLIAGTSFVDTSVTQGQKYFYVVSAQSSSGNQSAFSNEVTVTIPTNPNPPPAVTGSAQ